MLQKISKMLALCVFALLFCCLANAQSVEQTRQNVLVVGGKKTAEVVGKSAVIVLKETAKVTWKLTKFATSEVAVPLAANVMKPLVVKTAPKVTLMLIKNSGILIKRATPVAAKLLVTYLKL